MMILIIILLHVIISLSISLGRMNSFIHVRECNVRGVSIKLIRTRRHFNRPRQMFLLSNLLRFKNRVVRTHCSVFLHHVLFDRGGT